MIGYRKADGSTVLPDGSILKADGSRLPPGTSKYPPDAEIGGLHPVTLPDEPAATGLPFTVQASAPRSSGSFSAPMVAPSVPTGPGGEPLQEPGESDDHYTLRLAVWMRDRQYASAKRRFTWAAGIAVVATATAIALAVKKGGM